MTRTPSTLLERLQDPADVAAWSQLVFLFTPLLLSQARAFGLQTADAEDLVQKVFMTLLRELPGWRYDRSRSFRGWLYTVTRNLHRDTLRAQRRARDRDRAAAEREDREPEIALDETEARIALLHRAIALIRPEFAPATWTAFWDTAIHGRHCREVAADQGLSLNAVYLARSRVLRRLKDTVSGLLD